MSYSGECDPKPPAPEPDLLPTEPVPVCIAQIGLIRTSRNISPRKFGRLVFYKFLQL